MRSKRNKAPLIGSFREAHPVLETLFRPGEIDFIPRRSEPETQGCNLGRAINNGVGSMSIILQLIYREYCRACLQNLKYF